MRIPRGAVYRQKCVCNLNKELRLHQWKDRNVTCDPAGPVHARLSFDFVFQSPSLSLGAGISRLSAGVAQCALQTAWTVPSVFTGAT